MSYLDEAIEILDQVKGKPQSLSERERLSVELAALMLHEAEKTMTSSERKVHNELSRLMQDPVGKAFTTVLTDECFRSSSNKRIADQMIYLITQLGIPEYLSWLKRAELYTFKFLGPTLAQYLVPLATKALRKQTEKVILPGESGPLIKHLRMRKGQGVRQNINHLGEAILSEAEAKKRLHVYLEDLKSPDIDYVSIKVSTIYWPIGQ